MKTLRFALAPLAALMMVACMGAAPSAEAGSEAAGPPVEWDTKLLWTAPQTYPCPEYQVKGLQTCYYDGVAFQGRPTKVFAVYGVPEVPAGQTVPGMVLVHGGGGTAFADWVKLWVKRGYAAIAMDLDGCIPVGAYNDWKRLPDADAGPLGISNGGSGGMNETASPLTDQWGYHAVAAVMRAHSLLASLPGVDAGRIGMTGISWGGYLSCLVAAVDTRLKFAAPIYGCGFLGDNSVWVPQLTALGKKKAGLWLSLWDPSQYLPYVTMPMLWVDGTNDFAYPLDSVQKSYRLPATPRTLSTQLRMIHGHGGPGENPVEIAAFAGSILKGEVPLATVQSQGRDGNRVWAIFAGNVSVKKAQLLYTKATGNWEKRVWAAKTATFTAENGQVKVEAELPDGVAVYYLNLQDTKNCVVSTEHVELMK